MRVLCTLMTLGAVLATATTGPKALDAGPTRPAMQPGDGADLGLRPIDRAFMPVESEGLLAQITSISSTVNLNQFRFGSWGASAQRSISIGGSVYDLSGTRAFRIVGRPRVLEFTDEDGQSVVGDESWSYYPDATNPQAFTQPQDSPGNVLQQSFSISSGNIASLPRTIRALRIALDVAVAGDGESYLVRAEPSEQFTQVAPGVEARVTMVVQEGPSARIGLEYRLSGAEGEGHPVFLRAQVLDDEQRVLQTGDSTQEARTKDTIVGAVTFWGVDTSEAPAWYVRLELVPTGQLRTIELSERDLPLMGWGEHEATGQV